MALIAMAVYSSKENKKDECLERTLGSLSKTVDFSKHQLVLSINGRTEETDNIISYYQTDTISRGIISEVIYNDSNLGTAEAVNKVIRLRKQNQHVIKMDDDVVIHQDGWVDEMEEAIRRDNKIGIIGLKRRDLIQTTWHPDPHFRSVLKMLPHEPGQKWLHVEETGDVMGTCTMYNPALLDKIGYLRQIKKYGYDDNIACHRSHLAGFYNCFLTGIDIEHIDNGGTPYQDWKQKHSGECTQDFIKLVHDMIAGKESIYYNPFEAK